MLREKSEGDFVAKGSFAGRTVLVPFFLRCFYKGVLWEEEPERAIVKKTRPGRNVVWIRRGRGGRKKLAQGGI